MRSLNESQRDSSLQPKVATQALPWVQFNQSPQPQRGLCLRFAGRAQTQLLQSGDCFSRSPRATPSPQPRAEGRNPFGIIKSEDGVAKLRGFTQRQAEAKMTLASLAPLEETGRCRIYRLSQRSPSKTHRGLAFLACAGHTLDIGARS